MFILKTTPAVFLGSALNSPRGENVLSRFFRVYLYLLAIMCGLYWTRTMCFLLVVCGKILTVAGTTTQKPILKISLGSTTKPILPISLTTQQTHTTQHSTHPTRPHTYTHTAQHTTTKHNTTRTQSSVHGHLMRFNELLFFVHVLCFVQRRMLSG